MSENETLIDLFLLRDGYRIYRTLFFRITAVRYRTWCDGISFYGGFIVLNYENVRAYLRAETAPDTEARVNGCFHGWFLVLIVFLLSSSQNRLDHVSRMSCVVIKITPYKTICYKVNTPY